MQRLATWNNTAGSGIIGLSWFRSVLLCPFPCAYCLGSVDRESETEWSTSKNMGRDKTQEKYEHRHNQLSLYYLLVVNELLVFKEMYPSKPFTVVTMQSFLLR